MTDNPEFERRPLKYIVIDRIKGRDWKERARFDLMTDAGSFVRSITIHSRLPADLKHEAWVVIEEETS